MTKIVCRKKGRSLIAVDDEGAEALAKVRDDRDVIVEFRQVRNPRQHRLYFAILKFIKEHAIERGTGESLFETSDLEVIHIALKLATGLVKSFIDKETGRVVTVPMSIAFESMDQARFAQFFDCAVNTICQRWLPPGVTSDVVRNYIILMVDGPHALDERMRA